MDERNAKRIIDAARYDCECDWPTANCQFCKARQERIGTLEADYEQSFPCLLARAQGFLEGLSAKTKA